MSRRNDLAIVLDAIIAAEPERAVTHCPSASVVGVGAAPDPDRAYRAALESFAHVMAARFDEASALANEAVAACAADDVLLYVTAHAARALAQAGRPFPHGLAGGWASTGDPIGDGRGDSLVDALAAIPDLALSATGSDRDLARFACYLVAEAALASARLHRADDAIAAGDAVFGAGAADRADGFLMRDGRPHPFGIVLGIMRIRVLTFRGRIAEAIAEVDRLPHAELVLARQLRSATEILVRGNAAERQQVKALADALTAESPVPHDYLTRGCFLLTAFGLVALGDTRAAARTALVAGGDLAVSQLMTVDRALCLELLVAAAADEDDRDAAEAWAALALPLRDDPIAASTVHRILARVALLARAPDEALQHAERALTLARAEGRVVEEAEAEVIAARARRDAVEPDSGASRLIALAASAELSGHLAARRAAVRELRASGRRLPPVPGVGWNGLSTREREIAVMVADGLRNVEIAAALHLSEHTVRGHVSRVLAAFGAASRFVVAARMAELFPGDVTPPTEPLTPQLTAVAAHVAAGLGNVEIGRELGVSTKTVEKYVAEVQRRWQARSRVAIARLVRSIPHASE